MSAIYRIMKHPKEVKHFLRMFMRVLNRDSYDILMKCHGDPLKIGQVNCGVMFIHNLVQFSFARFFNFQKLKRNDEIKAKVKLPDLRQGVIHALNILKIIDDP